MAKPFFLDSKPIKKEKEDLLSFSTEIEKIKENLSYFDLFLIVGKEGSGKTSFLNLLKSSLGDYYKISFLDSSYFFKKTKKIEGNLILIDDLEELCLLNEAELLFILKSLRNKKIIASCNITRLKNWSKENEKQLIFSFLAEVDYVIRLENFYTRENLTNIVKLFENEINKFGIYLTEEEKDILFFIVSKKFKFNLRKIKKFFLLLYVQINSCKKRGEEIKNLKAFIPRDLIISYMWDKELSKYDKVSIEKIFSPNLVKKQNEKKEEIMDINSLIDKYQKEDINGEKLNIEEVLKSNPSLIEEGVVISDYMENMIYKGITLKDLVSYKPQLIGYKNDKLFLIYIYDNLKDVSLKEIDELGKNYNKLKKEGIELVIVTTNTETNRKLIKDLNLLESFKIVFI